MSSRDLFGSVNSTDPVGIISDAGRRGIFQSDIRRMMGWSIFDVGKLHRLVRTGRIRCHRHGSEFLYYLPGYEAGILNARRTY